MKKAAIIIVMVLTGTMVFGQTENPAKERRTERKMERKERRLERRDNHGQAVSGVAQETPGGPEKGEIVSGVASSKRQDGEKRRERNVKREQNRKERPENVTRPERPQRPARPERPAPTKRAPQGRPGGR
jgi:hypothetical protein